MKKYLLTACYLLLTFIIFKHPVEFSENEPSVPSAAETEQSLANNAVAKKSRKTAEKDIPYKP